MKKLLFLALILSNQVYAADTTKTATASWQAVTKRMDGTALPAAELKGYVLQYQRNSEPMKSMDINSGLSIKIPNLGPGTYKFALKAVDTDGLSSEFSPDFQVLVGSRPAAPVLTILLTCDIGCTGTVTAP